MAFFGEVVMNSKDLKQKKRVYVICKDLLINIATKKIHIKKRVSLHFPCNTQCNIFLKKKLQNYINRQGCLCQHMSF